MRCANPVIFLSTLAAFTVATAALSLGYQHKHAARHVEATKRLTVFSEGQAINRRDVPLPDTDSGTQKALDFISTVLNPTTPGQKPWIGSDADFTNEFINQSGEPLILVLWGPGFESSWVDTVLPQLALSIAEDSSQTVSFPIGWSGAWAPIYSNTNVSGQILETWGEGTINPPYSVVDVSREVNMKGRSMSIVGPSCTTDMDTCVFKCSGDVDQCLDDYELVNCATGSQVGANSGTYDGKNSGGCGGMGSSAALKTYLG